VDEQFLTVPMDRGRIWKCTARGSAKNPGDEAARQSYSLEVIDKWLKVFLDRFFRTSQYKRSALPNGPKVSSGGALSPRGDWRAPSDAVANVWLDELSRNGPKQYDDQLSEQCASRGQE
jgi:NAD+ synthase (glutamine-hydrolysing)